MVAYDSRRALDPAQILGPDIVAALRSALVDQRAAGAEPTIALQRAIATAAREARNRELAPEVLLIQLKALADQVGIAPTEASTPHGAAGPSVREWMVRALLRAYWQAPDV